MHRRLSTDWTKHIKDAEGKLTYETTIRNSTVIASRLRQILEEKKNGATTSRLSLSSYESPNWAFTQADNVGYCRALNEIDQLLSFTKD